MRPTRLLVTALAACLLAGLVAAPGAAQYPPGPPPFEPPPSEPPPFELPPGPPVITIITPGAEIEIIGRRFNPPSDDVDPGPVVKVEKRHGNQSQSAQRTAAVGDDGTFTVSMPVPDGDGDVTVVVAGRTADGTVHLFQGKPGATVLSVAPATRMALTAAGIDAALIAGWGLGRPPPTWLLLLAAALVLGVGTVTGVTLRTSWHLRR